ncbi:MAG: hypothetical protein HFI90_05510 [Clostridia bacterium]|nr:hypothetical protein [Clostridia bacterium]
MTKKKLGELLILFLCGGTAYILIEYLFRGHSHPSMFLLGGVVFVEIGGLNEFCRCNMSLLLQGLIGSFIITVSELAVGLLLNVWLKLNVWDYSHMPLNFLGQICLPFSIAWIFVAIAAVLFDDFLRHLMFGEDYPHYKLFLSHCD